MSTRDLIDFVRNELPNLDEAPGDAQDARPPIDNAPIERGPVPDWVDRILSADEIIGPEGVVTLGSDDPLTVDDTDVAPSDRVFGVTPDALAWYLPFHHHRRWGIYLLESGLIGLAGLLASYDPGVTANDAMAVARAVLTEHEFFHFMAEVACTRLEVTNMRPLYGTYFPNRHAASHEEALANAHALRRVRRQCTPALRSGLQAWMRSQGPGYQDFWRWLSPTEHRDGRRHAVSFMAPTSHRGPRPGEFLFDGLSWSRSKVPMYLVEDRGRLGVAKRFPKLNRLRVVVHSREHPPPHVHIETPPGTQFTRYLWPERTPYPGDRKLSTRDEKNLAAYVALYGNDIDERVARVFAPASRQAPTVTR